MIDSVASIPYCGPAPLPSELWLRWNLDPLLLIALAALVIWHATHLRVFHQGAPRARRVWFIAGWLLTALSFISPLCALGVALFSARVVQHMVLALCAAPLVALAHVTHARSVPRLAGSPVLAGGAFAVALWAWHLPTLYDATLQSSLAYWLMHVSIGGTALVFWLSILSPSSELMLARIGAGFMAIVQMGLLGALITVAPRVLYRSHVATAPTWGLDALEDQQLGGLIMWVPAGATLLIATLVLVYSLLEPRAKAINR
jgi:putative membrane protein